MIFHQTDSSLSINKGTNGKEINKDTPVITKIGMDIFLENPNICNTNPNDDISNNRKLVIFLDLTERKYVDMHVGHLIFVQILVRNVEHFSN